MRWWETFSACLAAIIVLNLTRAATLPWLKRHRPYIERDRKNPDPLKDE